MVTLGVTVYLTTNVTMYVEIDNGAERSIYVETGEILLFIYTL